MPSNPTDYDALNHGGEPLTTPATIAALLTDAARFIEANDLSDDVLGVSYSNLYRTSPRITIQLRNATWSTLCAGLAVTWDCDAMTATGTATLPELPGVLLVTVWSRADLEAAALNVAAVVFPQRLTVTGGTWPGGVRS